MAQYLSVQEVVIAEKWNGSNYATVFEFIGWDIWDKRDNSASGPKFSIDNTPMEEGMEIGGDGILYVKVGFVMMPMNIGDYIIKASDGALTVMTSEEFESKYRIS